MAEAAKMTDSPSSFRLDFETRELIAKLAKKLGVSRTDIVRIAVRKLYEVRAPRAEAGDK
jgi:hypothetical protein